jgi:hypothetical protein
MITPARPTIWASNRRDRSNASRRLDVACGSFSTVSAEFVGWLIKSGNAEPFAAAATILTGGLISEQSAMRSLNAWRTRKRENPHEDHRYLAAPWRRSIEHDGASQRRRIPFKENHIGEHGIRASRHELASPTLPSPTLPRPTLPRKPRGRLSGRLSPQFAINAARRRPVRSHLPNLWTRVGPSSAVCCRRSQFICVRAATVCRYIRVRAGTVCA